MLLHSASDKIPGKGKGNLTRKNGSRLENLLSLAGGTLLWYNCFLLRGVAAALIMEIAIVGHEERQSLKKTLWALETEVSISLKGGRGLGMELKL